MQDSSKYTDHENEDARRFIQECITSALAHIGGDILESFQRKMSESRKECFAGADIDISEDVAKLLQVLEDEAYNTAVFLARNAPSPHENIRERRAYFEEQLPRLLRSKMDVVIRQHWLEIIDLCSKSIYKHLHIFPYCVQVCCALLMLQGKTSEMLTGEGKTIVGPLVAVPISLRNKAALAALDRLFSDKDCYRSLGLHLGELRPVTLGSIHFITSDSYLVLRDYALLESVYNEFGISTAYILNGTPAYERHLAYKADVVFGTTNRFAWDYLESLSQDLGSEKFLHEDPIAIIDEIDHSLIDEASAEFLLGVVQSENNSERMLVYQVFNFFQQFQKTSSFLLFNEKERKLDLTGIGSNLLDGWLSSVGNRLVARLRKSTVLGKVVEDFFSALEEDVQKLTGITDKGRHDRIENLHLLSLRDGMEDLWVNPQNSLIRRFCHEVVSEFSVPFLAGIEIVINAATLVSEDLEAVDFTPLSQGLEWDGDRENIKNVVENAMCRLLAMGLTQLASDPAALLEFHENLRVFRQIKTYEQQEQPKTKAIFGSPTTIQSLSSILRSLVIHPSYKALLEQSIQPEYMENFLLRLGEMLEYAFRDAPAFFSQWANEIPEQFLRSDLPEGQIAFSDVGIERLVEHLDSLSIIHESKQDRRHTDLRVMIHSILKGFDKTFEQFETVRKTAWQDWWAESCSDIEEPLRKELIDLESQVTELISDFLQKMSSNELFEEKLDTFCSSFSSLFYKLETIGAPPEICNKMQGVFLMVLLGSAMLSMNHGNDIGSLSSVVRRLKTISAMEQGETTFTIISLVLVYAVQICYGQPVTSVFGHGRANQQIATVLQRHLEVYDIMFEVIIVTDCPTEPDLERITKALLLRGMVHSQFPEHLKYIIDCLGILILGQHMCIDNLIRNQWLKQALYGHLDELKQLGLLESYSANCASRILEKCFRMETCHEDEEYIIRDIVPESDNKIIDPYTKDVITKEIAIIDQATGRIATNSRWDGMLHEVLEAKHNMFVLGHGTSRSVTMQILASKIYTSVIGMSGTLKEVEDELHELYGIEIVQIPPNRSCRRNDHPNEVFLTKNEALESLLQKIIAINDDQRPILIRCVSVSESERVYDYLCDHLPGKEIKLLNGRPVYANKEAEVIAESGTKGSIVVSTQIVGRGVDIKLQDKDKGLYALGFERQPFSRWDRQFSGRSGRQGDLGDSQFFCSYEHLFTSKGAGRVWPEHAPIDDERIRSEIEAYQRIRSKDSRTIRRQRIQRGQVIYNINSIFTDRIKVLASPDSSCLVCRDGNIDYGQFPGICVRCSHCLNKIKQTGQPCIQSFCIREGSLPNYYVYNSKNNACAWALIHEEFLDSKNPSLLSSIYVEAIEEVHYKLLSEVADWVNYIAAESLYPDHWATRFDRYYLNHMCRTIFGCQLDSGRLEQLEREYGLPGSEPIINPLSVYLKELMGKQIVTSQCPWRQLLKESHELVQESTESVDPPITDVKYRWYLDPNEMMLSPCQILQFLSRRLFGGSPVRMIRDVNGQMSYIADELNVEQCIAADKISRQIAIACLNNAWDQWYRRLDDIEDSRDQYHRNPLWDFDKQAQQYANRYLRIAQLRMVDCLIRVCRIADLKAGEDNLVAFSELLTPVCELLGWDPQDVACCIARKEDPLLGLLNLVIHLPDDSDLLKPIEFAEDLHEGGKML